MWPFTRYLVSAATAGRGTVGTEHVHKRTSNYSMNLTCVFFYKVRFY